MTRTGRWVGFLLAAVAMTVGTVYWCNRKADPSEPLVYGQLKFSSAVLVYLAEADGYIAETGLSYRAVDFPAGPDVLTALRARSGGAVAGTASTTPVASWIGAGGTPVILACIYSSSQHAQILTFTATNITKDPATLKGKRIGLARNTLADVYLANLLRRAGLTQNDITLVAAKPPDLKAMLLRGDLDAAIIWDPFIVQAGREYRRGLAEKRYPDRGEFVSIVDPTVYQTRVYIVTSTEHLSANRARLVQLLQAVKKASDAVAADRALAQKQTEKWLGLEDGDMATEFATASYRVSFDVPELKKILKEDLDWVRESVPSATVPDDLTPYFDPSLLRDVAPDAVKE